MSGTVTKRDAETRLWESYRPALEYFFMVQNRTRNEIRDVMAVKLGFDRSPAQYDARFKKWGFRKNFHQEEWKRVNALEDERQRNGRSSAIENAGRAVKRAPNKRRRHYESTLERIHREMGIQDQADERQLALILRTPSPKLCVNEYVNVSETLWYSSLNTLNRIFNITHQNPSGGIPEQTTDILFREISRTTFQQSYVEEDSILNHYDRQTLRSRILDSPCVHIIDIENTVALRTGQAFLDLIKLGLYLISNNIARNTGIGPLIVSACQSPTSSKALEHLLQQKTPTVQAFADGLMHYATEANDKELIRKLVHSGVSPNGPCERCNICRVQCAISMKADHAAIALLDLGASLHNGVGAKYLRSSFEHNLISVAKELLRRGPDNNALWDTSKNAKRDRKWDIVSTAAFYGGIPAVNTLTSHHPLQVRHAVEMDNSHAFSLAAGVGHVSLVRSWMSRYKVSTRSCGIGLCGAAANGRIDMVALLLSHSIKVDGEHGMIYYHKKNFWKEIYCDVTALEAALGSGQISVAELLIGHGANAKIRTSILNSILWPLLDSYERYDYSSPRSLEESFEFSCVAKPSKFPMHCGSSGLEQRMKMFSQCLDSGTAPDEETLVWLSFVGALGPLCHLVERGYSVNAIARTEFFFHGDMVTSTQKMNVTALAAALYAGNDDIVGFLLQNQADINAVEGIDGDMSALAASIIQGRLDWSTTLIRSGCNPKDPIALWASAYTNSIEAYDIVITAITDNCGTSAAAYAGLAASEAIRGNNIAFLQAIVDRGININSLISPWQTRWSVVRPFMEQNHPLYAAVQYLNLTAVQMLLDIGVDPNFGAVYRNDLYPCNDESDTWEVLNCIPGGGSTGAKMSIASALIGAGANVNHPGPAAGQYPLGQAISTYQPIALINLFIREGALVNAASSCGHVLNTPLGIAVSTGRYEVVRLLLTEGARLSSLPRFRRSEPIPESVIQTAAYKGYIDILKLLLGALEEEDQFISEYPLALRLAQRAGHRGVAQYLQTYRAEKFEQTNLIPDEVILKNLEDRVEDWKYWYEFCSHERYEIWEATSCFQYSRGTRDRIRELFFSLGPNFRDSESEGDTSPLDLMLTDPEQDRCQNNSNTSDDHVEDLAWEEYFDFDLLQRHSHTEPCDPTRESTQVPIHNYQSSFPDVGQRVLGAENGRYDTSSDSDNRIMAEFSSEHGFAMLEEQIWDIDEWVD